MINGKEIVELIKAGELDKAYAESRNLFESNPEDHDARIVFSKSIKALMDRAGKTGDASALALLLEEYGNLGLEAVGEREMNNKAAWDVRALLLNWKQNNVYDAKALERVAQALKGIDFVKPHRYYSVLLDAMVRVKDAKGNQWPGIVEFVDWWGMDNLLPEDYEKVRIHNGQTIPSLAERVYTANTKALLAALEEGSEDAEAKAEAFVIELGRAAEQHPEFQYTDYYRTLLLKALGRMDEAVQAARTFVKRRQYEFWSWSMLGDIVDDEELKLSCYCRALICKAPQPFVVRVHEKLGLMMYQRGEYNQARREFDEVKSVSEQKGWRVPQAIQQLMNEPWYAQSEPDRNNMKYYFAHLGPAQDFLMGDVPETSLIIVKFNPQKGTCSFITEDRERGFFVTKRFHEHFSDNQIYRARIPEGIDPKGATKILSLRRVDDVAPYEGIFFRRVRAELNIKPGQTFTFIEDIYVDGTLLSGLQAGDMIDITAVIYYNIKRESWGWRAVRVTPAN